MQTLFDLQSLTVKPRLNDGTYCSKRTQRVINELRWCIVGEVRRKQSEWKTIRRLTQENIDLKAKLKQYETN